MVPRYLYVWEPYSLSYKSVCPYISLVCTVLGLVVGRNRTKGNSSLRTDLNDYKRMPSKNIRLPRRTWNDRILNVQPCCNRLVKPRQAFAQPPSPSVHLQLSGLTVRFKPRTDMHAVRRAVQTLKPDHEAAYQLKVQPSPIDKLKLQDSHCHR